MNIISATTFGSTTTNVVKATVAKLVNYTPEQTQMMISEYLAGQTVESLALTMGKSLRSVVAKLSREKVYVAKTYTTKTGERVAKKDTLSDEIGALIGATESEMESMAKANKTVLVKLLAALKA